MQLCKRLRESSTNVPISLNIKVTKQNKILSCHKRFKDGNKENNKWQKFCSNPLQSYLLSIEKCKVFKIWFNKVDVTKGIEKLSIFRAQMSNTLSPQTRLTSGGKDSTLFEANYVLILKVIVYPRS